MSNRKIAANLVCKQVEEYLDTRYENPRKLHYKSVLQNQDSDSPEATKINEFTAALLCQIGKEVFQVQRDKVLALINTEVADTVENLLSEEEAEEFCKFASSDVGRKVFRNLDLIRESYANGMSYLQVKTIEAWDSPNVEETIQKFIKKVTENEDYE